ncbi:MAG: hypothetical protein U1E65_35345 [Myxococcota bacterium]
MTPTQLAFELFEHVLNGTRARYQEGIAPIAFDLLGQTRESWSFDPHRRPRLFEPTDAPGAALRIRARPELLVRLFFDPELPLEEADAIQLEGDPQVLAPLIEALADAQSGIALRASLQAEGRRSARRRS